MQIAPLDRSFKVLSGHHSILYLCTTNQQIYSHLPTENPNTFFLTVTIDSVCIVYINLGKDMFMLSLM